jgi:uncharacterized membrane protein YdjX (TVP38/TMEM64 family)
MRPDHWAKPLVALGFIGGLMAFFSLGGYEYLSLETIKSHRQQFLEYTESHYAAMLLAAGLIYTAAVALSVPGAAALSLVAGFLFGRWMGTLVIVFAATLGGVLVFLGARYLFGEAARTRLEKSPAAAKILSGFERDAFHYLLFLRLVPVFPFWLVNLTPAFTGISLRTYFAATAIGILPGSFVFANLGQSLGRIESLAGLVSSEVMVAFALLGALALLPVFFRRRGALSSPS